MFSIEFPLPFCQEMEYGNCNSDGKRWIEANTLSQAHSHSDQAGKSERYEDNRFSALSFCHMIPSVP